MRSSSIISAFSCICLDLKVSIKTLIVWLESSFNFCHFSSKWSPLDYDIISLVCIPYQFQRRGRVHPVTATHTHTGSLMLPADCSITVLGWSGEEGALGATELMGYNFYLHSVFDVIGHLSFFPTRSNMGADVGVEKPSRSTDSRCHWRTKAISQSNVLQLTSAPFIYHCKAP